MTEVMERPTLTRNPRIERIMAWDLSRVKQYLVNREGMTVGRAEQIEPEYKRFIALNVLFPDEKIPIAGDVDEMWHTHIMFTENYEQFCRQMNNGRMMHHRPTINEAEAKLLLGDFTGNTLRLYERVFGKPDMSIWHDCVCVCDR